MDQKKFNQQTFNLPKYRNLMNNIPILIKFVKAITLPCSIPYEPSKSCLWYLWLYKNPHGKWKNHTFRISWLPKERFIAFYWQVGINLLHKLNVTVVWLSPERYISFNKKLHPESQRSSLLILLGGFWVLLFDYPF